MPIERAVHDRPGVEHAGAVPARPRPAPLRDQWRLEPGLVFLNHGSFGACPRAVLEAQDRLRSELEADPVRFLAIDLEARLDAARERIAGFVRADPEDLVFVPNATTAVNAVLRSVTLLPGDEVVMTDHEYPATRNAMVEIAARAGARVVEAAIPLPLEGPDAVVAAIAATLTRRTRLVMVSHITSATAIVLPVERIVAEVEGRGIPVLVDGAHGPGMLPLDLAGLGASYYAANLHKWVCAPKGAGFLHVRRDRRDGVRPPVVSHGASDPRPDRSRFHKEFDWTGTIDPTAILAAPAAVEVVGGLVPGGWPEVMAKNAALAFQAREILLAAVGTEPLAPASMLGSMAAVELPGGPEANPEAGRDAEPWSEPDAGGPDPLSLRLRSELGIRVPISPWPVPVPGVVDRTGARPTRTRRLLRVSAHLYNALPEYEYLAAALAADLAAGRR